MDQCSAESVWLIAHSPCDGTGDVIVLRAAVNTAEGAVPSQGGFEWQVG